MTIKFDTTVLHSNAGKVERLMPAIPAYDGVLHEGLLMMHVGDKAIFAISADTIAKFMQPNQMPQNYESGKGQKFYYEITLSDIVTKDEYAEEQANYVKEMQDRQKNEPEAIAAYVNEHNIKVKPTDEGLYVIVKKAGKGPKVAAGRTVAINYTGTLLDGTMFDSSVEADAQAGGIYNAERQYEPLTYVVGQAGLIRGWDEGVMGQPEGTTLQLIVPSALGYGPQGRGQLIQPYTPLVFELEIVSVK